MQEQLKSFFDSMSALWGSKGPVSTMTAATQKATEQHTRALRTLADASSTATQKQQTSARTFTSDWADHLSDLTTCKTLTDLAQKQMDFVVSQTTTALEDLADISQTLSKAAAEAQSTWSQALQDTLSSAKTEGSKALGSDMVKTIGKTNLTKWWSDSDVAQLWQTATWWPTTASSKKGTTADTTASTETVVASGASASSKSSAKSTH